MNQRLIPAEIAHEVGMTRASLDSYLRKDSIREELGGVGTPPTFPRASLPMFANLRNLRAEGVTPLELAKTPERLRLPETTPVTVPPGLWGEGRLLTEEEAAVHVACPPAEVSRYVAPLPPRYSLHDIQAYIRGLRDRLGEA